MRFLAFLALILTIFSCTGNRKELKGYLNTLDSVYYDSYYYPEMAKVRFTFVTQQLDSLQKVKLTGEINCIKSFHAYQDGDIELSLDYLKAALPPLIKSDNKVWQARSYLMLGWIAETTGNWQQAKQNFYNTLNATSIKAELERGSAYLGIARCNRNLNMLFENDLEKGIAIIGKSDRKEFRLYASYIQFLNDTLYLGLNNVIPKLLHIKDEYKHMELFKYEANVNAKISSLYLKSNQLDSALIFIDNAIDITKKVSNYLYKLPTYYHYKSSILFKQKDFIKSNYYAHNALQKFKIHNNHKGQYYCYLLISRIEEVQGQISNSFKSFKRAKEQSDKAIMVEKYQHTEMLEIAHKTELLKSEIKDLHAQLKRMFLIVIVIVSLILSFTLIHSSNVNKKRAEAIEHKSKIQELLIGLGEKNYLLEQLKSLRYEKSGNKKTDDLLATFDECFPKSSLLLKEQFPDFTFTDIRYAIMFGLNFDNGTIIKVNNTTIDAVKKAKRRLRDKIGIGVEKSINEFFKKYIND